MLNGKRAFIAIILGLLGCLVIWLATPYNNYLLRNSFITDSYIPVAAVILMLLLTLAINPPLRLIGARWTLSRAQLALVFAMLLIATVVPGQGLLRTLPWSLTRSTMDINMSPRLVKAIEQSNVRLELFPDPIGVDLDTPVSRSFTMSLTRARRSPGTRGWAWPRCGARSSRRVG